MSTSEQPNIRGGAILILAALVEGLFIITVFAAGL